MAGKGDKRRPEATPNAYSDGYDLIWPDEPDEPEPDDGVNDEQP